MLRISTLNGRERMSTRELLTIIANAVEAGEHDFFIAASGQHDIGGPLWSADGLPIKIEVSNPGQRVGGMCLPGTRVIVEGAAPADAGWLNSGGEVIVKGDSGDTTAHCAASGKICIGGRSGTRTGALMKHDPLCEPPEVWILKNTGSFSFEFMGGGIAVVCGHDCLNLPSVLGERPCVGMVDGVVYFRGNCPDLPDEVIIEELTAQDQDFLAAGLKNFLADINKSQLLSDFVIWKQWRKIVPASGGERENLPDVSAFHKHGWFEKGIFEGNPDHEKHIGLVPKGEFRLRQPVWENENNLCVDCRECLRHCPVYAIKRRGDPPVYISDDERCMGCSICAAICPKGVWHMKATGRE